MRITAAQAAAVYLGVPPVPPLLYRASRQVAITVPPFQPVRVESGILDAWSHGRYVGDMRGNTSESGDISLKFPSVAEFHPESIKVRFSDVQDDLPCVKALIPEGN